MAEGIAQAGHELGALPQPLPILDRVREQRGMAIAVTTGDEVPAWLVADPCRRTSPHKKRARAT